MRSPIDVNKVSEGIHYEIVPSTEVAYEDAWEVRMLEGIYVETLIRFGVIKVTPEDLLSFNYKILSSPITDLSEGNEDFTNHVGSILADILFTAESTGTLLKKAVGTPSASIPAKEVNTEI
jgi:hypothetical protein|tara:strand:- start:9266 stop:9628 length:363 start_codon:yes stop_codon:yes gene_type:complete